MQRLLRFAALGAVLVFAGAGCKSVRDSMYYGTMSKFGVQKRDILADRVDDARESQQKAKVQFQDALKSFMAVVDVPPSQLEDVYNNLKTQYERSREKANAVNERISAVEDVAQALFSEWRKELGEYSDPGLRRDSERELRRTQERYNELMDAMKEARDSMQPVLDAFNDRVLFMKHNLNAMAIASLEDETADVQRDVTQLVRQMEKSIKQADDFIAQMRGTAP